MKPYKFSDSSKEKLLTCDARLQRICNFVIKEFDFTVITGFRNEKEQNEAWKKGYSEKKWADSKHNTIPSSAIDIAPYPIDWQNRDRFMLLAGRMLQVASMLGIKLRWGGDWNMDNRTSKNKFDDLGHFEIVE